MLRRSLTLRLIAALTVTSLLAGCLTSTRAPERLYPVIYEMDQVRASQDDLIRRYYEAFLSSPAQAKAIRNELIAQRMYAIDIQYTIYENALTREGQEVGFGALTAAEGLTTAATLVTPAMTKSILSAAATGVLAVKGHYDSEILIAQTMRTIQKQMRASRNLMAAKIVARMDQSVSDYPLSIALSDIEEYYSAGTLTSGVIDTSTTVGIKEDDSKLVKQVVAQAPAGMRGQVLANNTNPGTVVPSAVIAGSRDVLRETPKRRSQGPDILDPFEGSLLPAARSEIQRALCLAPTGSFGPADSPTRRAIASYLSARGKPATQIVDQRIAAFLDEAVEKVDVRNGGTCAAKGLQDAAAVGRSFLR